MGLLSIKKIILKTIVFCINKDFKVWNARYLHYVENSLPFPTRIFLLVVKIKSDFC